MKGFLPKFMLWFGIALGSSAGSSTPANVAALELRYLQYSDAWHNLGDAHLDVLAEKRDALEKTEGTSKEWAVLALFLINARFNEAMPLDPPSPALLEKLHKVAKGDDFLQYRLLMTDASLLVMNGKIPEAGIALQEAETLAERMNVMNTRAEASLAVARLMFDTGRQDQAIKRIEQLEKWLDSAAKDIHPITQEGIRMAAAFIYDYQGKSERAISILEDVLRKLRKTKMKSAEILVLFNLATLKKKSGSAKREKQAIDLYEETYQLASKMNIDLYKGVSASALAGLFRMQKDYQKGERYAREGAAILQNVNPMLAVLTKNEWAHNLAGLERWDEADQVTRELESTMPKEYVEAYVSFLDIKVKIAAHKKDWQRAYQILREQADINEKQARLQKKKDITEAEARLGMKLEEQKNRLLEAEKDLESQKFRITQQQNQMMNYATSIGVIFLLVLAISLLALYHDHHKVKELQHYITGQVLQRFLPPGLVDDIVAGKSTLENQPHEALVTILFCDLCDFTAHTERLGADAIAGVLNTFFMRMTEIIFEENGTIDKFIGDAIMVLFGAPQSLPAAEQARHAVACAEKMQEVLRRLNTDWQKELGCTFQARIGIHQGPVIVGSFGSTKRSDYTVVGIAVNTAARVEGVTTPDAIWITQDVRQHLDQATFSVGTHRLKGLEQPLELFQVTKKSNVSLDRSA